MLHTFTLVGGTFKRSDTEVDRGMAPIEGRPSKMERQESRESLLLVDADPHERTAVDAALRREGRSVHTVRTVAEAVERYKSEPPAVVVATGPLDEEQACRLVHDLCAVDAEAVIVVACPEPSVEFAVTLMKEGAFHVLTEPASPEKLDLVVTRALEQRRLKRGHQDLQNRLDLNERLAMIGRLASGVAHELNNPLDGVRRYVRIVQDGLESGEDDLRDYLDHAMSGLSRMAGIVRQLLTFSRNVVMENERESLRTMLEEVVRTLAPSGSAAPLIGLHNPYVDISVTRALFQVFVNLLRNALDAVEEKAARGRVEITVQCEGDEVRIIFSDNGTGIAEEDLQRVFEPFFTTKEVGRGTGLGLPISARIVERCGGTMRVQSEPGEGTTFVVTLPADISAGVPAL